MSTRSQIEFIVKSKWNNKVHTEKRLVYRHSDGYPSAAVPDIVSFIRWNRGRNTDVEYMAANFLYWSKKATEEWYIKHVKDKLTTPGALSNLYTKDYKSPDEVKWNSNAVMDDGSSVLKIGFGVCAPDEFHGDIEWFYTVEVDDSSGDFAGAPKKIMVVCHKVGGPGGEVKRKDFKVYGKVAIDGESRIAGVFGFDDKERDKLEQSVMIVMGK